jgi:hypothetical protein
MLASWQGAAAALSGVHLATSLLLPDANVVLPLLAMQSHANVRLVCPGET